MKKEFSAGFIHDLADMLEICQDNKTDNVEIEMEFGGHTLLVDIRFEVKQMERGGENE